MANAGALTLHASSWNGLGKFGLEKRTGSLRFPLQRETENKDLLFHKVGFGNPKSSYGVVIRREDLEHGIHFSYKKPRASALKQQNLPASSEEDLILKREAEKVVPCLGGQCVYLVGMMGSGKTTVGKILSEALGYSFLDSDKLVELAVGADSVAQIFEEHSEDFFRNNESKVLKDLSIMRRLVVATGGGAVIRPINWRYMKKGVTVWLDVPLEALARRIAAVGTASRPLLNQASGDDYTKALTRLTLLFEERGYAYENADVRVCLQEIAAKQDVNSLTPMAIAIEALIRMKDFLETYQLEEVPITKMEHKLE